MKCRVCGYELGEDRTYCPMCGTKVLESPKVVSEKTTEMAWNTKDFPKPKEMEDIDMNWGSGVKAFMSQDASEGFASIEKEIDESFKTSKSDPFELPGAMKKSQSAYSPQTYDTQKPQTPQDNNAFDAWHMPPQEVEQAPLWYTQNFTASGVMKTGPAFPIGQPQMPTAAQAAAALSATMPDATIQYMRVDNPKPVYAAEPAYKPDYDSYKPDYDNAPDVSAKKPERFNTFVAKNEEFQKLLDEEYERIQAMHAEDADPIPSRSTASFIPEARVQAQSITDFEKSLFDDTFKTAPKEKAKEFTFEEDTPKAFKSFEDLFNSDAPAPAFKPASFAHESDVTELDLDELIADPINPQFDINTIEMTIKELEEADARLEEERKGNQSKLEAMKAAREAYFKFLDTKEEEAEARPKRFSFDFKKEAKEVKEVEKVKEELDATPIFEVEESLPEVQAEEEFIEQDQDIQDTQDTVEIDEDVVKEYSRSVSEGTKLPDELVGLYDYEDEEEEVPRKRTGFLKFILGVIIVIAVFEGGILLLQRFMPGAEFTAQVTDMHTAVIDAITNAINKLAAVFGAKL